MRVYFCPYCAAMWASMRPLYEEHIDAGDEVYVMPLPYAKKDAAGFEGKYLVDHGFPVETVEPGEIEDADRIYIHNPYDDDNRITRVEPRFWSDRLKKCTKELVFVPYYTMGGDLQSIILSPGVHNADRIIVWSEGQKEHYRRTLQVYYGEDWTDKITVKQRPAPKHYDIPPEWSRMQGKRVVFLGTSIGALLRERDAELQKIRVIVKQYQQDGICLLWRPHPLYEATIKAMLPGLEKKYRNLVALYLGENYGIFDLSPDFERAVYLSDEYIGDPSSVVSFFQEQGKPVVII